QLYDHTEESAMATTGDYGNGAFYADPLCLVVPGPPANLPDDEPYLYLVIYPEDWDGTGDIDNTPTEGIQLTWEMVSGLLNDDGTTNEYHHIWVGECEGAIGRGDGGGNGGNGGSECNPANPEADCDNDGILNECDPDNVNWAGFDCDGDEIPNGQENEGCVDNPDTSCGETTECTRDIDGDGICDDVDSDIPCTEASTDGLVTINLNSGEPFVLIYDVGEEVIPSGAIAYAYNTTTGDLDITIGLDSGLTGLADINEYYVEINQGANSDSAGPEIMALPSSFGDEVSLSLSLDGFDTSMDIQITGYIIYCDE
ncbi:MAG: hypothetical protein R3213_10145, partial [Flavobacteriaceae bacterium]|nr:hypothetical protein [Flavobacteriaceae bacterium]